MKKSKPLDSTAHKPQEQEQEQEKPVNPPEPEAQPETEEKISEESASPPPVEEAEQAETPEEATEEIVQGAASSEAEEAVAAAPEPEEEIAEEVAAAPAPEEEIAEEVAAAPAPEEEIAEQVMAAANQLAAELATSTAADEDTEIAEEIYTPPEDENAGEDDPALEALLDEAIESTTKRSAPEPEAEQPTENRNEKTEVLEKQEVMLDDDLEEALNTQIEATEELQIFDSSLLDEEIEGHENQA